MSVRFMCLMGALLLFGCTPKTTAPVMSDKMGDAAPTGNMHWGAFDEATDLKVGETFGIRKTDVEFTFSKVVTDSRCPTGLDCFRAGEAVLLITLSGGGTQRVSVPAKGRVPARFSVPGASVTVLKLNPYPVKQEKIAPQNYILSVKVGKASVD